MKCLTLALLLALGAVASATLAWTPGREYVYEYRTRTMTGIPYLKNQVSGLGIRSKVIIQVQSNEDLLVKMTEIGVARVANKVFPESWTTWRKELPLSYTPLESSEGLSIPFKAIVREGQIKTIEVSSSEPIWSVNIKRALASQLSLSMNGVERQGLYTVQNEISKRPERFFTVEEEPSVTGRCKTYYTVVPLAEYVARLEEREVPQELKARNEERPAWVITKTKDYNRCDKRPNFIHSSVVDMAEHGSSPADAMHKRFMSRNSIARYLIRGEPSQKFVIERVWTEGEFVIRPFATNTESIFLSSNQTLVLKQEVSIQSPIPEPSSKVSKSLVYEMQPHHSERMSEMSDESYTREYEHEEARRERKYERLEEDLERQLKKAYKHERHQQPWKHYGQEELIEPITKGSVEYPHLKKAITMWPFSGQKVPVRQVQEQIKEIIEKVEQEIESLESMSEVDIPIKMVELSRAFVVLDLKEIQEIYRELFSNSQQLSKHQKTLQTLFLDGVVMAGTNPCVLFLKEVILRREVKGERAAQLLMALPATVKTPTPELIRELVQLCKEVKSFENKQVWYTALLSTSTIINRACVDLKTRRHRWGVSPTSSRPYCTPEAVELFLPYLKSQVEETQSHKNMFALVQAIGNLGSRQTLPVLKSIIYGHVTPCKQIRSKAIFALSRLAQSAPRHIRVEIQSILKPIFTSPLEEQEVRMSAFIVLLTTRPNETFFTEAATGTWFETNQQVGQLVYSTLYALANCSYPTHYNLTNKATMALPLAKKYNLGVQYSNTYLVNHMIPNRHIGSILEYIQFSGKHSLVPEQMYMALRNHLGGFDIPILETSFQIQGIQNLINRLVGPENREEIRTAGLDIHTRKDYPLSGSYWLRLMGSMERVFTVENLKDLAMEGFLEYTGGKTYSVNYQKTLPLQDIILVFPLESGLPVYISKKIPLFVSVRGNVEIEMDSKRFSLRRMEFPSDIKIKMDLKPIISTTRMIEVGVSSPLTKEVFLSGHKTHSVVTLPGQLEAIYRHERKEIELIGRESQYQRVPQKMDILSVKTYPYTAQTAYFNFMRKNIKPIKAEEEVSRQQYHFGRKYTGVAFEFDAKVPGKWNFGGLYNLLKPHTILSASQFMMIPHNLREYEYRLRINVPECETKEIKTKITYDTLHKKFSMSNFEEEEMLEAKHYKHKHGKFSILKESWKNFLLKHKDSESSMRYEEEYNRSPYSVRSSELRERLRREESEEGMEVSKKSTGKTRKVHMEMVFEGSQQKRYRSSSVLSVSPCSTMYKYSFMFEREGFSGLSPFKAVGSAHIQYPYLPVHRQEMLEKQKQVLGFASLHYGQSAQHKIEAHVQLKQTQEWRQKVAQSLVTKECEKLEQEGAPYSPNCLHARRDASALNRVVVELKSDDKLPRSLYNYTLHADDLFKAYCYPYMTNKRMEVQNPENTVKIVLDVKPVVQHRPYPLVTLKVFKPRENTFIEDIKISPLVETILPFNAEISTPTKALNKILGYEYTPFCELSREHITTFDNVTYKYPLENCYHLVAKDCSKKIPVEVLAKQDSEGKHIKMIIGKMIVEITPERKVMVNGSPVNIGLHEEEIFKNNEGREVLVVLRSKSQKVIVTAPIHGLRIKSDGKHFRVEMSHMYRGRVCGLCGDMNGEKVAEFKDPKGCIRLNWQEFGQSYAVGSCARSRSVSPDGECMREMSSTRYSTNVESREYEPRRYSRPSSSAIKYVNKVVPRQGETCFSVKPIPECALGTKPTAHVTKEMGFHCVPRGRVANDLIARSRVEVLEEMVNKPVDFKEYVSMPESCEEIKYSSSSSLPVY